jgi:hypothetical protein
LWERDARQVRALADSGEPEAALEHYFRVVGERWDLERLVTTTVPKDAT